jgi:hypothetical protein
MVSKGLVLAGCGKTPRYSVLAFLCFERTRLYRLRKNSVLASVLKGTGFTGCGKTQICPAL